MFDVVIKLWYDMMTPSNGNTFRVPSPLWGESTGGFPSQRPVTRMKKRLSKLSWRRWFETLSHSLCRHCNELKVGAFCSIPGCSTAKLIYRSKEDYANGEPKKEEVSYQKRLLVRMTWQRFPHYWSSAGAINRSPLDSPRKGPVMRSFDFLFCW